ncbi:MAG: hypothetical protein ABI700_15960 [Chloroflexota bacterium]
MNAPTGKTVGAFLFLAVSFQLSAKEHEPAENSVLSVQALLYCTP